MRKLKCVRPAARSRRLSAVGQAWLGDDELVEMWIRAEKDLAPATALFPEAKLTFELLEPSSDARLDALTGLTQLKTLTQLKGLNLAGRHVTDAGLKHLEALSQLQELNLDMTQVTDAGLDQLKGLTNLGQLGLFGTEVTEAGVAKLQKALPNCYITR